VKILLLAVMAIFARTDDHAPKDVRGGASLQVI